MRKYIIIACLILTLSNVYTQNKENLVMEVNTPHTDHIYSMDYLDSDNLLITGSDDGSIRIWDQLEKKVLIKMQVSHMEIKKAVINPVLPVIAFIETDGISNFFLSVWNYREEVKLYSKRIQEVPLSLKFSPQGTWLVYSLTKWDSFSFIDSLTGNSINNINISNQIVYDFLISSSEKTVLLYKSSGSLDYFNTDKGTLKKSFKTEANLINTSFNKDNVLMAASRGKRLYVVDLLTGSSIFENLDCDEIHFIKFFRNTNKIFCITNKENTNFIEVYIIKDNKLLIENRFETLNNVSIDSMILANNILFYSGNDFNIYYINADNNDSGTFIKHTLMDILDIAFMKNSIILNSKNSILEFKSDFFSDIKDEKPAYFTASFNSLNNSSIMGIEYLNEDELVIWNNTGDISIYNPENKTVTKKLDIQASPVIKLETIENSNIIFIQNKNKCLLYNNQNSSIIFDYNYTGFITSTITNVKNIVAGSTDNSSFRSPLIFINTETGETVPLLDNNLLTYDIEFNEKDNIIFTLGLESRNNRILSVIKHHSGKNYDKSKTLFSYNGEDNNASILFDNEDNKLYTSMGFDSVKLINQEGGVTSFMKGKHIPRKLYRNNKYIYSLNRDKSITIWNMQNGKIVMDFYVFSDFNWIALLPEKGFYSSANPDEFISIRSDMSIQSDKLQYFKLR